MEEDTLYPGLPIQFLDTFQSQDDVRKGIQCIESKPQEMESLVLEAQKTQDSK